MLPETRQQLAAAGWSEGKILRAELRQINRELLWVVDARTRRSLTRRRREIKDVLNAASDGKRGAR